MEDADTQTLPAEVARLLGQLTPPQLGRFLASHLTPGELARMLGALKDERVAQLATIARERAALQAKVIELAGDVTSLPDVLYAVRVVAGMSQYDFADALGVRQSTVSHRETGRQNLTRESFAEVVAALPDGLAGILCSAGCPLRDRAGRARLSARP